MSKLYRFGISLEKPLIDAFDKHIRKQNYQNRSEAIRDLIRNELVQKQWKEGGIVAGVIVMNYNHHKRELVSRMLDIQHDFQGLIISTQHIHLTHHDCLEIIATKGKASEIGDLASRLKALIGVKHVNLSITSVGDDGHGH
ncbi:MAG TPA: nickel-responsive transcriptional regulator NikR [Lentisphaeria bacterium]|nr:MAG: nickel-responsive regulator [Lentisphaerae bacterium GWF2_49_21]HBC89148.1 nickel-responsive transcriptional regulator NikR [Lentisphaeria bacterium]